MRRHRPSSATGLPGRARSLAARFLLGGLTLAVGPAAGQEAPPSPAEHLGYGLGERFTPVHEIYGYFETLAAASPLVSVEEYGRTPENRRLIQVVIAALEHRARLDGRMGIGADGRPGIGTEAGGILWELGRLTDPELSAADARTVAGRTPAVVYFSYGVHGNESSSPEAAMWTAWDLARGADEVAGVLDSVVVVIDPVVNPDGRARYVNFYRSTRGPEPNADPVTREHDEPWPGGRTNHYYFDLNRDWTWMSQPETRARLATWNRWNPQIHVDFHEMSPNSSYFFFPPATPVNPLYPAHTAEWARRIGEGNAAAFSEEGWLYFTEESYDLFYPGYGDSWPSLLGAIGMTYEQAGGGSAGLAYARSDGDTLTLHERATHHRVAGNATLRTAAMGKTELLEGFARFHREVDAGLQDILLVPGEGAAAQGRFSALLRELRDQGIRYSSALGGVELEARPHTGFARRRTFPGGTVRVSMRQPRGRLAATLLQDEVPLDATYSYDISAWSRPYAYGVEAHSADAGRLDDADTEWIVVTTGNSFEEAGAAPPSPPPAPATTYGYLVHPSFEIWPEMVRFLEAGGRARVMPDTFRIAGDLHPRGTFFLPAGMNRDLRQEVGSAGFPPSVLIPVSSALTETGPDLGSGSAGDLRLPRVALLGGEGTSSNSYGAHRFFLEHRLAIPFDNVDAADLGGLDLGQYDVVVVPEGSGTGRGLSESERGALMEWIRLGGTLVAAGSGARGLEELTGVAARDRADPDEAERLDRALRPRRERQLERWESNTPGTILEASIDPGQPLAFGAAAPGGDRVFVLSSGNGFEPSESFESAVWYADGLEKTSGVISDETLSRLSRSSWLVERRMGRGSVILFADDPLFRMMWYQGFQPYANAILLGSAF